MQVGHMLREFDSIHCDMIDDHVQLCFQYIIKNINIIYN